MSHKNPNHNEIIKCCANHIMVKYFGKCYFKLAKKEFSKRNKRKPTLDDALEVMNIFEEEWKAYYIDNPIKSKENRLKGKPIWQYGCKFKVDVYNSMCRFLEYKYSPFTETPDRNDWWFNPIANKIGYYTKSAADIMKEMNIEFMESHIIDNNLLEEYKQFIDNNKKTLDKHTKSRYIDYSHLAYNGVTDDF